MKKNQVYVLELEGGKFYVGSSTNVDRRLKQHFRGAGAEYTKRHKPTGKVLPRLGKTESVTDSGEREETLLQMKCRGLDNVRGWRYVREELTARDKEDIQREWAELLQLCRACGSPDHMAAQCPSRKRR